MISAEAYRTCIGRFYYKCKCLSNVKKYDCFCQHYETYFMKICDPPIKTENLIPIKECNGIPLCCSYMFYKYIDEHHEEIMEQIECYDVSFIELLLLLLDGDIESNPGPVQNNVKTPGKGRPKKVKGMRGAPKKFQEVQEQNGFNIMSNVRDPNIPLGLFFLICLRQYLKIRGSITTYVLLIK